MALAAKAVVHGLDETATRLFVEASRAYAAYVSAMGAYAYEVYIEGSIRNMVSLARERVLYRKRAKELAELEHFVAAETSAEAASGEEKRAKAAFAAVTVQTSAEKAALDLTQSTWSAFRDAEARFYGVVFGPKQGVERVERALRARLDARRAHECQAPGPDGE